MAAQPLKVPMHKNRQTTMARINGYISTGSLFRNIGLTNQIYDESRGFTSIEVFSIPGPHGSWQQYTFQDIVAQQFQPTEIGRDFGPTWTTHWFRIKLTIPATWQGKEIHFRWASGCEATLYTSTGKVLQGISPGYREEYIIAKNWDGALQPDTYYVEMACNHMFGAGDGNDIAPPNNNRYWRLDRGEIAVFNRAKWSLLQDFEMMYGIANKLGEGSHIGMQAMCAANEMMNVIRLGGTPQEASAIATAFFAEGTGTKAHQLYAMGHCHIDTAWLWPYDETIRKCARSFSAQMRLMEEYEDEGVNFPFVCSSAQQYAWVQKYYPDVFADIKEKVEQGKFIPVGGTWVEQDGYMPSGESFIRQFYYGQRFFQQELNYTCKEFWLPDTFGYSPQIPQLLNHCGMERFLTQKMSWSLVNKFPNHNFIWEGIDGSQVITHFPPGDSYNMQNSVDDFVNSQNNSLDKGRTNVGIVLFGNGDGGGGPTRQMIERLLRVQNTDGLPKVKLSSSNEFFDELSKDRDKLYKWVGELYLELHNGTYTSQAKIKWYNRKSEFFLREVELLMAIAYATGKVTEDQKNREMIQVDTDWQNVLLNQFHDVLPGSCIQFAAEDAWKIYEDVFTSLTNLRNQYHARILRSGTNRVIYNTLPWDLKTVVFIGTNPPTGANTQAVTLIDSDFEESNPGRFRVPSRFTAALVNLNASGYTQFEALAPTNPVQYTAAGNISTFTNGLLTLQVDTSGSLPVESLRMGTTEVFSDYLNKGVQPAMFYIYDDVPMFWDAWDINDYHLETRRSPNWSNIVKFDLKGQGPIVGCYRFAASFGNSSLERYTIMRADSPMIEYYTIIDWHEDHKLIKVEFPMDVLTREATYEVQYGHVKRPTHINTSWDMAKYEVCGHKWMNVSQADKGVTIITDSKYGFHARDNVVQVSLLKSPKNPDGNADMHKHFIYYAVLPHTGTFQEADVIRRAYELNFLNSNNIPYLATNLTAAETPANWVVADHPGVIVEAVKISETATKTLCIRLYESHGGSASTTISISPMMTVATVKECSGLEVAGADVPHSSNSFQAEFRPFQIRSYLITFP